MTSKKHLGLFTIMLVSIISMAFILLPNKRMDESLVGHWSFDEKRGSKTIDKSSYKSNGEIIGVSKRSDGIVGKGCLELNGKGDYIEILENGTTPSQLQELNKGSISVWFKARNIPVGTNILPIFYYGSKNGCDNMKDASNEGLVISLAHGEIDDESQGIYFTIFNNPCEYPTICFDSQPNHDSDETKGTIHEGEWYHFVVVVGEDYNTGYLNGEEILYRSYNFSDAGASQFFKDAQKHERLWIGKGFWDFGKESYFDGFMDDLRIYDIPLSGEQVKKLYEMKNANS